MNAKLLTVAAASVGLILALAGCASSSSPAAAPSTSTSPSGASTSGPALSTASTSLGTIVVDGSGMTVYFYDADHKGETTSVCTGGCASAWPPVTTTSSTPKVSGITGTVGTIAGPGGSRQLTIDGLPVYTYSGDSAAGQVGGQGSGGSWWVVNPNGSEDKTMPGASTSGSSSTGSSSSSSW